MGNVPVLKAKDVVKILEGLGFVAVRQRGSHKQFRHNDDGRGTTIPIGCFGRCPRRYAFLFL